MNSTVKTVVFWLVIVFSAFLLWQVMKAGSAGHKEKEVNFSQFLTEVDQGNVKEVTITAQEVRGKYRNDNSSFHTTAPANYPDMIKMLRDKGVSMNIRDITNPADADGWEQSFVVWEEPGSPGLHAAEKSHLQGRGRRR